MRRFSLLLALFLLPFSAHGQNPNWWLGGGSGGGGLSAAGIQHPTASVVTLTSCYGAIVSNSAASATQTVVLCNAAPGMEVYLLLENAAETFIVEPVTIGDAGADDSIVTPETDGTPGSGLSWVAPGTVGSVVHLISLSADEWRVMDVKGATPVDNASGAGDY